MLEDFVWPSDILKTNSYKGKKKQGWPKGMCAVNIDSGCLYSSSISNSFKLCT